MSILLAGIDEVGYGPKLGPLLTVTALLRAPQAEGIRNLLVSAITSKPSDKTRIVVCDSKKLYNSKKGIRVLERNVLPFIAQSHQLPAAWKDILYSLLAPMSQPYHLPYMEVDVPKTADTEFESHAELLKYALHNANIKYLAPIIQFIQPAQFNELILETQNKSTMLFNLVADMIHETLRIHKDPHCLFRIGKQGGKTYYADDIKRCFPGYQLTIVQEQKHHSQYLLEASGRKIEIHFLLDGEDLSLTIALASIIGKYFRELAMGQFNEYWKTYIPGIRSTAGYLPDADRFLDEIQKTRLDMHIPDHELIRSR